MNFEDELAKRAQQQAAVAELGQCALADPPLSALFDQSVNMVAEILEVEYCKVLELLPDGKSFLLRSGVGWKEGLVGCATVDAGTNSQAGYSLLYDEPVVVEDLRSEHRFSGPQLLHDHRVISGMSVLIQGKERSFGVMGTHTTKFRIFSTDDVNFFQSIANVLAEAIERKRTEEALARSKAEFEAMFNSMPDAVMFADTNRIIVRNNPALHEMFGYSDEELVGQTTEMLYADPADFMKQGQLRYSVGAENDKTSYEVWYKRKDGTVFISETIGAQVKDAGGKDIGFIGIFRDITERKNGEEELKKHRDHLEKLVTERTVELEAANKELESFNYSVSHDLRAPLRGIDGFSQALLEDYNDSLDDQGKDYLKRVRAASQRMGELIDDMLTLSRVTRSEMHHRVVDLSYMAEQIAEELKMNQTEHSVEFIIKKGLFAKGDTGLLRVLLENLFENSWKFSGKQPQACIEFGHIKNEKEEIYFVRDNGAGFDMKYASKLFGPFQRLHGNEFEGTGIGLATVQRIVHRHGGRVWAEGEVGKGATFYFTFSE